ncbi:hypothetical protein CN582_25045 [Bacillus wiedmannii]|nr:hypothetical protein CN582_25045 [Bacillus wiedmannii]
MKDIPFFRKIQIKKPGAVKNKKWMFFVEVTNKSLETRHIGHSEVAFYQIKQTIPTGFTLLGWFLG